MKNWKISHKCHVREDSDVPIALKFLGIVLDAANQVIRPSSMLISSYYLDIQIQNWSLLYRQVIRLLTVARATNEPCKRAHLVNHV